MRIMDLYVDQIESSIIVKDNILMKAYSKHIFNSIRDMDIDSALNFACETVLKYGVKCINIYGDKRVGVYAYERLVPFSAAENIGLRLFDESKLV